MMFYDEATAELKASLGGEPGWSSTEQDAVVSWEHAGSGTTLRMWNTGSVMVINDRLLAAGHLHYRDGLRHADSMGEWVDIAKALATRDKKALLHLLLPGDLNV